MEYTIAAIVLNWNGYRDTIECLESLLATHSDDMCFYICDNGSKDGSLAKIVNWAKQNSTLCDFFLVNQLTEINNTLLRPNSRLTIIANKHNSGYSGGNNIAIRYAMGRESIKYIWLLNNDTVVLPNAVQELIKCTRELPDVGIWGSTIVEYYQPEYVQCAGGARYNSLLAYGKDVYRGLFTKDVIKTPGQPQLDYISGASMFVKKEVFQTVGLLPEDYFLYFEEIDLADRCKKAGFALGWCKHSIILHKEGASVGTSSDPNKKSCISEYYSNISALKYTKKSRPGLLWGVAVIRLLLKSLRFIVYREFRLIKPLLKAYKDFIIERK